MDRDILVGFLFQKGMENLELLEPRDFTLCFDVLLAPQFYSVFVFA